MREQARVVIVGGGIMGCSLAYHLAKAGWTDVVVLDKGELTSGSTCQAVGKVTAFNVSPTMMRLRRRSIEMYTELGVFERVGSLRLASSREQLTELQRSVSRAKGIGLEAEVIPPDEAARIMPAISREALYGAVFMPDDGHLDPHRATYAVANAARSMGVEFNTDTRVIGIELSPGREVKKVRTNGGDINTEAVINCAGIWAPQVASMVGLSVPSTPVDHQHVMLKSVPGHELPRTMPCFRDPDNLVYGREESGGMILGGYEPNPAARWLDGVPWDHSARSLPPDYDRFEQLMEGAIRHFPFLSQAEIVRLVSHPDAMTPDGIPLLGPMPGVRGFWMAAGLSLNGFGGAGGIGQVMAEWMTEGATSVDVHSYHAWRFGPIYRDTMYAAEMACECYKYYYRLRYPFDQDEFARPKRVGAVHHRLQDLGCVFGKKNAWERPEYFEPDRPWRRAGADQRQFGYAKPPYFDRVGQEHHAFRERVGLIDMSSFGKIEISGPGALALLQHLTDNDTDRPDMSVIYTQFLNERGGVMADITITRLARDRFRLITGAGFVDNDLGWIRAHIRPDNAPVMLRDVTEELTCLGMWGPKSRQVLEAVTPDNVSNAAFPYMTAKAIGLRGAPVLAQRVTYVGELGWELYMDPAWATHVWDALMAAGHAHGIRPGGYRALDSLRLEKGYKYYSTDVTMLENPYEAGLGFCVRLKKGAFIGRQALAEAKAAGLRQKLCIVTVGGPDYLTLYGGEAVHHDGEALSRLRSAGYGYTVRKNIGLVYLPVDMAQPGVRLHVDVFGEMIPAEVRQDVLYDPEGARLRV
jgi:glycine cleavage system aminomethyltransferase T/glycine/D-amino acid oxidase-like deaminating enzyme